jgi:hypothetical protein
MGHKNERRGTLLPSTAITEATPHIQFPILWVLLALSPGMNWPERENDFSSSYNPKNTSNLTHDYGRYLMEDKCNLILT